MPNKTVYVKDSDLPLWERVQDEFGESVSALLSDCLKRRVESAPRTLNFSRTERLILLNQFQILAKVDPKGRHDYDVVEQALSHGYSSEYESLLGMSVVADELPRSIAQEVIDTLDLYRMLQKSFRDMNLKDLPEQEFAFLGFDGNDETEHFAFALYLVEKKGRWAENKASSLNSHTESLPKYRRMIARWKQCPEKWHPTESDVREIIAAGKRH